MSVDEAPSPYVPLVNRVNSFQSSLRQPYVPVSSSSASEYGHEMTRAQSPVLMTKLRSRRPSTVSTDELEAQELQTAPRFRAREVDRRVGKPLSLLND